MNGRNNGVTLADSSLQPMCFMLCRQAATPHQALIVIQQSFIWVHPALTGHVPLCYTSTSQLPPALTLTDPAAESGTWSRDHSSRSPGAHALVGIRDCTMEISLTLHQYRRNPCPLVSPGRFPRQYIHKISSLSQPGKRSGAPP